ncbi:MAG: hypothetical protein AB8H12_08995 [Lewinella sp.]
MESKALAILLYFIWPISLVALPEPPVVPCNHQLRVRCASACGGGTGHEAVP